MEMELTSTVLQPLGVSAILAVLVFILLKWIMALVKDLRISYDKNTEVTTKQNETLEQLKDINSKVLDRFEETIRSKN